MNFAERQYPRGFQITTKRTENTITCHSEELLRGICFFVLRAPRTADSSQKLLGMTVKVVAAS